MLSAKPAKDDLKFLVTMVWKLNNTKLFDTFFEKHCGHLISL